MFTLLNTKMHIFLWAAWPLSFLVTPHHFVWILKARVTSQKKGLEPQQQTLGLYYKTFLWNGRVGIIGHGHLCRRRGPDAPSTNAFCQWNTGRVKWDLTLLVTSSIMEKGVHHVVVCQVRTSQDSFTGKICSSFPWSFEFWDWGEGQNLTGKKCDVADCWAFPDNIGTNKGQGALQEAPDSGPCEWVCRTAWET